MSPCQASTAALLFGAGWLVLALPVRADDPAELREEVRQLREQNLALERQLQRQQAMLEALSRKVGEIQESAATPSRGSEPGQSELQNNDGLAVPPSPPVFGRLNLSGEGAAGFYHSGPEGMYPNGTFRLAEARLFLEAPIFKNVSLYGEVDFATPEESDLEARLGEFYLDIENVSQLWHQNGLLNVRVGRMYIPYGEEYQMRYAIDNPFVSRSLSDLWGVDEGLEVYGRVGKFSYAAAVQNGGIPETIDFTSDKSLAGRLGFDPKPGLHFSVSAMRTGEINVPQDKLSAMWFGGGFFRSLGSPATTQFQANLAEGDIQVRLPHGNLRAFGGYIHYQDNDPAGNNARNVYYYSLEGVHDIIGKLYGGIRFSQILAGDGFPIVGNGNFGDYFFGPLTTDLWRLSLDLGYRWSQNLVLKAEYTFEHGSTINGDTRNSEDLFAIEAAFKF